MYRFLVLLLLGFPGALMADVVRPALVEISTHTDGRVNIEVRASIEALLTGINAKYKNTQDSPFAEAYDELRVLDEHALAREWEPFKRTFSELVELRTTDAVVDLQITHTEIPEAGYTKVPRISVITLQGNLPRSSTAITWYYPAKFGDNAVRVRQVDKANDRWHWSDWQWIRDDSSSEPFSLIEVFTQQPWHQVVATYIEAGFLHIIPLGLDHILFILGLYLLSQKFKPLLWQVTMFTIAHTITLGMAMKGIVELPANIVEPLIALSIAYVGIENIVAHQLHKSRLLLVFAFGLLHGLGFASVLQEFGMPENAFATALISFNVGVEIGQLAILLMAFLAVGLWFRNKPWYRQVVIIPGSLAIAATGLYWTWDRVVF
ncbi:MAG: HupE/UreJ family protein [bacterium]